MELMRHSDLKLTMKVYTDASQLALIAEAAQLPSFSLPWNDSKERTQLSTQEAVVLGSEGSPGVGSSRSGASTQPTEVVAFRREKTAGDVSSGFSKMERAKRLELNAGNSEITELVSVVNSPKATDTQLSTHAAELAEIAAIWPGLSREIRTAVLNLIRVSKRDAT